ncbi:MAG: hypothetical protein IPL65_09785 [Lewinellaceae bacterium]|nr:hypothetical protein [Lewinellaceae bacterium]
MPLSSAAEIDNFTGLYQPVEPLAAFNNGQSPNGIWTLEICDSKAQHKGILQVFELVFAQVGCPAVTGLAVSEVQATTAVVQWDEDSEGDSLVLEYGPAGFHPGTGSVPGTDGAVILLPQPASSGILLSNLETLQAYEVYLRRRCGVNWWSPNTPAVRFSTNCAPTLLATFDSLVICPSGCADPCPLTGIWQNAADDDYEWKVRTGPGLTYPNAGPPGPIGGTGNYLFFRNSCSFSGAFGKTAKLRSLCLDLSAPGGDPCHFSFDLYMNAKVGQMGMLSLQVSADAGVNWTTVKVWSGNQGKRWRHEYLNLNAYDGQTVLLQFIATGTYGAYGDIAIDNLSFYGATPAGTPDYVFYRDTDGDGFGNPALALVACSPDLPVGYSSLNTDCDDTRADVFPGAPEILCNQIDENCNGMADDGLIALPFAADTAVCQGEKVVLKAQGTPNGAFYWYAQPGNGFIHAGAELSLLNLQRDTVFYLIDSLPTGCRSAFKAVQVTVHPTPELQTPSPVELCLGASLDLSAVALTDASGVVGNLSYFSALPPSSSTLLENTLVIPLENSVYFVKKTTIYGCSGIIPIAVTVHPLPTALVLQGDSLLLCRGAVVGVEVQSSGTGPFQYAWSNGLNLNKIQISAGNSPFFTQHFQVTVTDSRGCKATDQVTAITQNNVSQVAIGTILPATLCGAANGSITLTPLNGVGPYQISWSGPQTGLMSNVLGTTLVSGLAQGGYRVTITDGIVGCSMVLPQILINAPGLMVSLDTVVQPVCPDAATGCIRVSATGLNPQISWNTGSSDWQLCGLSAGVYTATVTDGNCSQVLSDITISSPPAFQVNLNKRQTSSCAGQNQGALELAVFGASPPYLFNWSNGNTGASLSALPPGVYQCTITDALGCSAVSLGYTLEEPLPLSLAVDTLASVACFGGNNGAVGMQAMGGTAPYGYSWSTGQSGTYLSPVAAGLYALTVTDAHGCTQKKSAFIGQPVALSLSLQPVAPTCIGLEDGSLVGQPDGGTTPYSWLWNTGANTMIIDNLAAATYQVTLSDANGCTLVSLPETLTATQLLQVKLDTLVPVSCFGAATGRIGIQILGASGNVELLWNGQPGGSVLENISGGQYQLVATDEQGCSISAQFTVPNRKQSFNLLLQTPRMRFVTESPMAA